MFLYSEATFTAPSFTLGYQVVAASDGSPFRQERPSTSSCRLPVPRSFPQTGGRPDAAGYLCSAINPLASTR